MSSNVDKENVPLNNAESTTKRSLKQRRGYKETKVEQQFPVLTQHKDRIPSIKIQRRNSLSGPLRPIKLSDFELLKKIGQGGFGEVYLSKKKDTGEILAMKIMQKSMIWARNKKRQVKNERDVMATDVNQRVVKLHYSFQDRHYLYLAMEFCPGGDLYHLLQKFHRLDENDAKLYFAEMVIAVHSLHQMGYIHRDLKPDNFLIDSRGHLKLADFGLSKEGFKHLNASPLSLRTNSPDSLVLPTTLSSLSCSINSSPTQRGSSPSSPLTTPSPETSQNDIIIMRKPSFTREGNSQHRKPVRARAGKDSSNGRKSMYSVVGSPEYMAPEVLLISVDGYGPEVDWWSLGCVMFDVVVGYPPFSGESPQDVFDNILAWKQLLPSILRDHQDLFSVDFCDLLTKLLCESDERLGRDISLVMTHPFFNGIDWNNLNGATPLFVPNLRNESDLSYFDELSPSKCSPQGPSTFRCYYDSILLKDKQKLSNPLQYQLERLRRSRSVDYSDSVLPPWVTPLKTVKRCGDSSAPHLKENQKITNPAKEKSAGHALRERKAITKDKRKKNTQQHSEHKPRSHPDSAIDDSERTPAHDVSPDNRQLLGFTFQRKPERTRVDLYHNSVPSLRLSLPLIDDIFEKDTVTQTTLNTDVNTSLTTSNTPSL